MADSSDLDYESISRANWDERAPEHAKASSYAFQIFQSDPSFLSDVVKFDIPLLGDITGLNIVHLQCHIGTDTLSLARRGARSVTGLDFSTASIKAAKDLASRVAGGDKLDFVTASVYDATQHLAEGSFDLVFTGIGAICWIPSIKRWAQTVFRLLKPGGRLFIRECHPVVWSIDEKVTDKLVIRYPYFETEAPMVFEDEGTYMPLIDKTAVSNTKTVEWNHGIGEIVTALLECGMRITCLVEHRSVPWNALPGRMVEGEDGEWRMKEGGERVPLTYTLQAVKVGFEP